MFGTMTAGCVALLVGSMCYSGDGKNVRITCSDQPMPGVFTCKEWNAMMAAQMEAGKRMGCMSADGSSSSCLFPMPTPPR